MISSTAAKSSMRLICAQSYRCDLVSCVVYFELCCLFRASCVVYFEQVVLCIAARAFVQLVVRKFKFDEGDNTNSLYLPLHNLIMQTFTCMLSLRSLIF